MPDGAGAEAVMSTVETVYRELTIDGYQARATGTAGEVTVRPVDAMGAWCILTVTDALGEPTFAWSPSWLSGESRADRRRSIEREIVRAIRAHHGTECNG